MRLLEALIHLLKPFKALSRLVSPSEATEGLQRPLQGFSWHLSLFKGLSKASQAFHAFKRIFKGQISLKAQKQFQGI